MTEPAREAFFSALLEDDAEELYERAPCGYLSTTPDGVIVKVNQTFLTFTGYARDDLVGQRTFAELLTGGGRIYHETHFAPMLRMQGAAREIALDIVRADGERLPVLVNSVLVHRDDGSPVVIRTAVFDATDRREYERELLRAKDRAQQSEARANALAMTLQQTLIPPAPPQVPGLDIGAAYRPAGNGEQVGGDFYDVFEIGPGDWVVMIGDVCGKGAQAAVVTALARYTLRGAAVREQAPSAALGTLNEALLHHPTDRFCTIVLVRLRQSGASWSATTCAAGHPLPLLTNATLPPDTVGEPGSLIGVRSTPALYDSRVSFRPGDTLVLYTDGVTEGRRGEEFFGIDRLQASVVRHAGTAAARAHGIVADVLAFQAGDPRDDIAVVVVTVPEMAAG